MTLESIAVLLKVIGGIGALLVLVSAIGSQIIDHKLSAKKEKATTVIRKKHASQLKELIDGKDELININNDLKTQLVERNSKIQKLEQSVSNINPGIILLNKPKYNSTDKNMEVVIGCKNKSEIFQGKFIVRFSNPVTSVRIMRWKPGNNREFAGSHDFPQPLTEITFTEIHIKPGEKLTYTFKASQEVKLIELDTPSNMQ